MAELSFTEKMRLEKFLGMGSGYVLDFSNRTLQEFVLDRVGKDIYDDKYEYASGSKANRLRHFWAVESSHVVGKLLVDLIHHARALEAAEPNPLADECLQIAKRLKDSAPVPEIDAITPNAVGREFELLAKAVRDSIERNEPELGLDRLHTFVVKYMRVVCSRREIEAGIDKPLHSLVGEYVKHLRQSGLIQTDMTERILKSSISVMEAFNRVRNDHSLAHDNEVVGYSEALLIYNNVTSAIRFINTIEERRGQ